VALVTAASIWLAELTLIGVEDLTSHAMLTMGALVQHAISELSLGLSTCSA
jgi:hypothetical protein